MWANDIGFQILPLPSSIDIWQLKLNNYGQVVGVYKELSTHKLFFWDSDFGFWDFESSNECITISAFNDNGQVLGCLGDQMYYWNYGKKVNLTTLFQSQLPRMRNFQPIALNNRGDIVFNAYDTTAPHSTLRNRAFLWKDNTLKPVIDENEWKSIINIDCVEHGININSMDDRGNMILTLYSRLSGGFGHINCFYNPSEHVFCHTEGMSILRNGLPIERGYTSSRQKKDLKGRSYFSKGIPIRFLIREELPYLNVSNNCEVIDQNSKGYVIGTVQTLYGEHAFLATPIFNSN